MSLLIAALIGLLALAVAREPGGRLWRMLIEAPARKLDAMTWRQMLVTAIVLVMAFGASELVLMDMAWVLAADIVAWIELFAAVLVVTRLAPGWRMFKAWVSRISPGRRERLRESRPRRARRSVKTSDDPDPAAWAPVFA
ncbi:hypothetical protein [Caulobacter sp. X]|uniref:hypothetical protein n=1 Tax=Caulobacter sp. X TaxID=2048901 RepID=UPI000C15CAC7|nr:hypothetical protein [Caulobacter sp. X]PIB95811.1 hypothetical protein CSW60_14635 [Caulobacter sp. X]